jgi:uncharacterized protein YaaW (UPF0174 family)
MAEWKLVLLFTFGLFGPAMWLLEGTHAVAAASPYFRILPILFVIQAGAYTRPLLPQRKHLEV